MSISVSFDRNCHQLGISFIHTRLFLCDIVTDSIHIGNLVIQLKTAFGGGKTHSMLALYHLLRGRVSVDKLTGVRPILDEAGVSELVKVHTAVLVGTALNPSKSRRPQNMPGITINTLWGEMAAQLAMSAGKPEHENAAVRNPE